VIIAALDEPVTYEGDEFDGLEMSETLTGVIYAAEGVITSSMAVVVCMLLLDLPTCW
jgi:hypothetical protein